MKLTGKKLQYAYVLVAEGKMSDYEIAKYLKASLKALTASKGRPHFAKRVRELRSLFDALKARREREASPEESSMAAWVKLGNSTASVDGNPDQAVHSQVQAANDLLRNSPIFRNSISADRIPMSVPQTITRGRL